MINTYLDIRLKKEDGGAFSIDKVFYCTNEGKVEVNPLLALSGSLVRDDAVLINGKYYSSFPFTFGNLCHNFPLRIIIYAEEYPVSCEYEWYNGANFSLMYAYHRLFKAMNNSIVPRINYNEQVYVRSIYKYRNVT